MVNNIQKVFEFHEKFNVEQNTNPTNIKSEDFLLRHNLMKEENDEYLSACKENNLIEIADALGDQLYILLGTICKHGLQHKIQEVFDEIHRSNLSKLDENGNPIFREDGKVLKGPNYTKPDIKNILNV